ncbi:MULTISPECIES: DEAD/DEAH box helicase [Anaeromyxobacter]|uniref:DEAD/DEAH box helicase n=1 Tax=Anaeromyxobacter TaxID=161492 RepID=UPI001F58E300|nr:MULTISPECIES: DEAD/DEAH box helicase [unclassified Anaeromyxobacter]
MDFNKLVKKKPLPQSIDPLEIFGELDRKASHVSLRLPQQEVLRALHATRKQHDHVLKMPTGTGKSAVGLLYLVSYMRAVSKPVVYLCPTVQLVLQVIAEASKLGIEAHAYSAGERHPHPRCLAAQAVIVCTYDKLFNALTTFDREEVAFTPAAIALDDVHSGVEEVRDAFTVRVTDGKPYDALMAVLDGPGRAVSPGLWDDIRAGRPESVMEIPYWGWRSILEDVRGVLQQHSEAAGVKFRWPFLRDALRWCRCVVSDRGVEIAPLVPLVDGVRAFTDAEHRLFMSATLADDSVLVRELGCDAAAAQKPVVPTSDTGLGERMVLAPSLLGTQLERAWITKWAAKSAKKHNVVVLCSSEKQARDWEAAGARVALTNDILAVVDELKAGTLKFAAFAQRYDGIDLPDDACRVLILDGVPFGSGIIDQHDSGNPALPGGVRNRTLNRIEQGMGRAVRSNADYAVCVLAGPELASFITRRDVQDRMSPDVRIQLQLAKELAELASDDPSSSPEDAFQDLVRKSLTRDAGWKTFYDQRVRQEVVAHVGAGTDASLIRLAEAERKAITAAVDGDAPGGFTTLNDAQRFADLDERVRAGYLQVLANLTFESDPGEAAKLQKAAFDKHKGLLRPPPGTVIRPLDPGRWEVAAVVIKTYDTYATGNGLLAAFQALKPSLAFGVPAHRFEEAFCQALGLIGADSTRPEHDFGEGPDNLVLWPSLSLVVEAKNEAAYKVIPKKDAEQLLHSAQWFKREYSMRTGTPVFVGPSIEPDEGIHPPDGTRVITPKKLSGLTDALEGFLTKLAGRTVKEWDVKSVDRLLIEHGLSSTNFVERHTVACKT